MGAASLIAVLEARGVGVEVTARELSEATGIVAGSIAGFLNHNILKGRVIKGGTRRFATYALSSQDAPTGRRLKCAYCGQWGMQANSRKVTGVGQVAVCCLPQFPVPAPQPKRGERSPEGRPKAESKEPWKPWSVERKPSEPAKPAEGSNVVRDERVRLGRYGVHPSEVTPLFSALGVGRYLEGDRA